MTSMFRFAIRDVLCLMVVVGMGVGWWLDHRITADTESRLATTLLQSESRLRLEHEKAARARDEDLAFLEAVLAAFKFADMPEEQKQAIRESFSEELKQRGISIHVMYSPRPASWAGSVKLAPLIGGL
jgi:hypothetical protein